jgi:uncharacterized RDD family membrane protein YckC
MGRDPIIDLVRRRTQAGWIDVFVLFIVGVVLSIISGNAHSGNWTSNDNGFVTHHSGVSINLPGVWFLLWAAIALFYYFIAELQTGQTIGKRVMGLEVTMVNGGSAGVAPVLLRTVGRIIDVLPLFYLVGWITMRGPRRPPQRLGDRLAGTTVVAVPDP